MIYCYIGRWGKAKLDKSTGYRLCMSEEIRINMEVDTRGLLRRCGGGGGGGAGGEMSCRL